MTRAVFFDVDFTLIYPGPTFLGEGCQQFCERYGLSVDPARFEGAVADASSLLVRASTPSAPTRPRQPRFSLRTSPGLDSADPCQRL